MRYDVAVPGGVIAVQTFGGFQNFNPHLHIIATDSSERMTYIQASETKTGADDTVPAFMEPVLTSAAMRKSCARLIQKVYQVNPLKCPKCQGTM